MKQLSFLLLLVLFMVQGCTGKYFNRIDELQQRIDALKASCDQINQDMIAIQALVNAIESKDMITGITEITGEDGRTGYKINFVNHESVTIYNGKDGDKPIISSKYDSSDGNYYWTVQYGGGDVKWMLDPDGNKMLSIGVLPHLTIRNGIWCYTLDGVNYVEIGRADGVNGDIMFHSFNTGNPDFVIITLSGGEKLKIPTYAAYLSLKTEFTKINSNTDAQIEIINNAVGKIRQTYLTGVSPILSGTDTVGTFFSLANGKSGSIYDWTSPMMPVIHAKTDSDGLLYWAYSFGESGDKWVLAPDGSKIPASGEAVEAPRVDVAQGDDGNWYWTVSYRDTTELLRYPVGDGYLPHAIEKETNSAFSNIFNYPDSLLVVLKDGTRYSIPKQYTVNFTYPSGDAVGDIIPMKMISGGYTRNIRYVAHGPNPKVTIFSEGGFSASLIKADGIDQIAIHAPAVFHDGIGKVTVLFTFGTDSSPVSVFRTFHFKKEE